MGNPKLDEDALNAAGWEFVDQWARLAGAEMPGRAFNSLRPMLRETIEKYLREAEKNREEGNG